MPNQTASTPEQPQTTNAPRFEELKQLVEAARPDFEKFYRDGNKAAGTRVRAAMLELRDLAQRVRVEVSAIKNAQP